MTQAQKDELRAAYAQARAEKEREERKRQDQAAKEYIDYLAGIFERNARRERRRR